jgi:S-DNA-T family DNA segregation ATPase FtsK/SpoIIIE
MSIEQAERAGGQRNLPAVPGDGLEDVIDGEVVESPAEPKVYVLHPVTRPVVQIVNVVNIVARHEHTRRTARHAGYAALGAYVLLKRWRESRTTARYERYIRAAETSGDHESALEWDQRRAEFLKARHERRMQRTASRLAVFLAIPRILLGLVIVLAVLGVLLAVAERRIAALVDPVVWLAGAVKIAVVVVAVAWTPVLLSAAAVFLGVLWHLGRTYAAGMTGGWLAAPAKDGEDAGMVVTADTIVLALQNLPIPELKKAFKDGWRPSFTLQPVRDGRGYEAEFSLPLGVTAEMIGDKRPVLARNLHREEIETWPSAGQPGHGRLWVADRGAIGKAAPEYPLLHEGQADVFEGVPGGVIARGDGVLVPVVGNNGVLGGMMGQGKSNAGRVVMLGCALDPLAELDVFVFANNGDFDAYAPRLRTYRKGVEDDTVEAAVARLHELYDEVARREGVSRSSARRRSRGSWPRRTRTCTRSWRCSASATSCSGTRSTGRSPPSWPPRPSSGPGRPRSRCGSTPSPAARKPSRRGWSSWCR